MILTGERLKTYGIKSVDLEGKEKEVKICLWQLQNCSQIFWWLKMKTLAQQSGCHLQINFLPSALSRCRLSRALINKALNPRRTEPSLTCSSSWEVSWSWRELSGSQLTLDSCHHKHLQDLQLLNTEHVKVHHDIRHISFLNSAEHVLEYYKYNYCREGN